MTPTCLLKLLFTLYLISGAYTEDSVVPGSKCKKQMDCASLSFSYCAKDGTCHCEEGMVPKNGHCVSPMLGTKCNDSKICGVENSECDYFEGCKCQYNFIPLSETECIKRSEYGQPCNESIQCSCKNIGTCETSEPFQDLNCSKNICACSEGYHYLQNRNTCVKTSKKLGDDCLVDENCLLSNTQCVDNKCACSDKFFVEKDQCVAGIGAYCLNSDCKAANSYCGFMNCECRPKFVELSVEQCVPVKAQGEDCLIDKQCSCHYYDKQCYLDEIYKDLLCSKNKTCSCSEGFHFVEERNSCIRSANVIGDKCEEDDNCLLLSNTKCKQRTCQCIDNYFVSQGQCKQGINSLCAEDNHCSAVNNAKCMNNKCQCNEKFIKISTGVCAAIADFGEDCSYEEQCQQTIIIVPPYEKLICTGTCSCSPGFHFVEHKGCIRTTTGVGGTCSVNENCGRLPNTRCWNNQCSCLEYHFQQGEQCLAGIGAVCSGNCEAANSICSSSGRCICAPGYIFAGPDRCVPMSTFGDSCLMDEQCSCLHQKCSLKTNRDLVCSDGVCGCPTGYHYNFRTKFCVHTATGIGEQCDEDANCEKILFAKCYNKKCECQENYFVSNNQCKQGIGSFCLSDSKCSAVANAKCVRNECKCVEEYVKQSTELCVPVSSFGTQCEYIEQCTAHTSNSTCEGTKDGTKICKCGAGQHHHGSGCFVTKVLDQQCDSNSECFVASKYDSVACLGNKCACVDGFVKVNDTYCDGAGSIISSVLLIVSMAIFAL